MIRGVHRRMAVGVSIALLCVLAAGVATAANPFVDIAGSLHNANIDAIYNAGITSGCDATHYCPDNPVTRGQMGTFLARTAGLGKNFPVTNGRGPSQSYCAVAAANPASFRRAACQGSSTVVDEVGNPGRRSSIAIGVDGLPIMSAMENDTPALRVTHCTTLACTGPVETTTINVGTELLGDGSLALAVGSDGRPVITFFRFTTRDLGFVRCGNIACTAGNSVTTIDGGSDQVGDVSAVAIGADGFPFVAYHDITNGHLKAIDCENLSCSGTTPVVVDSASNVGGEVSVAIGANGNPVIAYQNVGTFDLKVAACANPACSGAATITTVDPVNNTGFSTSITIGVDGLPVIAYFEFDNRDLWVAHCLNATCTSAGLTKLDSDGQVGIFTTIAIGTNGKPVIAYEDVDAQDTKLAYCTDVACGAASFDSIVTPENDGFMPSMTVAPDGVPIVSCAEDLGANAFNHRVQRPSVR